MLVREREDWCKTAQPVPLPFRRTAAGQRRKEPLSSLSVYPTTVRDVTAVLDVTTVLESWIPLHWLRERRRCA